MQIETKELFDEWIKELPENLKYFTNDFAQKQNLKLDYSVDSLNQLEKWIIKEYEYPVDLKDDEEILNLLVAYIGEVYKKELGGEWHIDFDATSKNPKRISILIDKDSKECKYPDILCTSSISRKKGNLLTSTLTKALNNKENK